MENKFKSISSDDSVLSLSLEDKWFNDYPMLTINQLTSKIKWTLRKYYALDENRKEDWFSDGISCEVLELGTKNWQEGKIRLKLTVEFCPNQPENNENTVNDSEESPLDDLRKAMNQNS